MIDNDRNSLYYCGMPCNGMLLLPTSSLVFLVFYKILNLKHGIVYHTKMETGFRWFFIYAILRIVAAQVLEFK